MDALTLTATSFIIAISLMITGREDKVQTSFIGLCLAIFVPRRASSFIVFCTGLLGKRWVCWSVSRCTLCFPVFPLFDPQSFDSDAGVVVFTFIISILGSYFIFTPLPITVFHISVVAYVYAALGICYFAIMRYVNKLSPGVEKTSALFAFCLSPCRRPVQHGSS